MNVRVLQIKSDTQPPFVHLNSNNHILQSKFHSAVVYFHHTIQDTDYLPLFADSFL